MPSAARFGVLSKEEDTYTTDGFTGLETSIAVGEEVEDDGFEPSLKQSTLTAPPDLLDVVQAQGDTDVPSRRISDRESAYNARRPRVLSPDRSDAFASSCDQPRGSHRSYKDVMASVAREQEETKLAAPEAQSTLKKRRRWCFYHSFRCVAPAF